MRNFPPWSSEASVMHWICRTLPSGSRNPDLAFPSSPLRTRSSYHGPVRTAFATLLILLLPGLAGGECLEPGLGRARQALAADDVPGAIASFEGAAAACREAQDGLAESAALRELASAEGAQRAFEKARDHLSRAEELARAAGSAPRLASILGTRANLEHAAGADDAALASFDQAVALARTTDDAGLLAALLVSLGNLQGDQGRAETALPAYAEAVPLAERAGDALLAAQAEANAASVAERAGRRDEARSLAASAQRRLELLPPSRGRIQTRIRVGRTLTHLAREAGPQAAKDAVAAHTCLAAAAHEAEAAGDARAASFAAGQLGELYEQHGRTADALEMTRRALLAAQTARAPESLYLWHWQLGRLHHRAGRDAEAIASLEQAVSVLHANRPAIDAATFAEASFEERVAPVYQLLVELLLDASEGAAPEQAQALLRRARGAVEQLKTAELRDYYRDGCVEALEARSRPLDEVSASAAILYPIVLPERLELLLSLPTGLHRVRVEVSSKTLAQEVRALRQSLEKRSTREYLPHAQALHAHLIAPILPLLEAAQVDTLVFVPDGLLRTIPLAALHDGERFLVERFALATSPGLSLTDPRPLDRSSPKLLLAGLSRPREGFPALPAVRTELEGIGRSFGGRVLLDEDFRVEELTRSLEEEPFTVVHIASHGEFAGDASHSFLLAGDGRISMDRLEEAVGATRFRERPVELLSLTACETASGDARSALGLAGMAVKAGARSALGSLWRVEDGPTAELVTAFYAGLAEPGVSRAEALRRAQVKLLQSPRTAHPGFWSPFLLISSWL